MNGSFLTRPNWRLWLFAALGAIALHGAGIAMVMSQASVEEIDDANGSAAIEIGLERTAPRLEPADLPAGSEAEASAAAAAVQEQKAVAQQSDLPKETPVETEDPDRLVTPDVAQKQKEDEPAKTAIQAVQSNEAVASEAAAPPTSETAAEAERSVAPVQGNGDSARKVIAAWQKQLVSHLDRHKQYPSSGAKKKVEVVVRFTLDRTGHVVDVGIEKSSDDQNFDNAAVTMVRRSDPVPPPPALVADEGLTFTRLVMFNAKNR